MPLRSYTDEADFRATFISPLLTKLGFILITHSHGYDEQGKDFFFADFDRFEHMRFYAAQAKLGNIGAGASELDTLLNQVRRAFRIRIRNRKEAEERRVSAVYLMTNGTISSQAREYIAEHCRSEPFGENVYFLDGASLEQIDQKAQHRSDQTFRSQLVSLVAEVRSNLKACNVLRNDFSRDTEVKIIAVRCRLRAVEAFLVAPVPSSILSYHLVDEAWIAVDELNRICEVWSTAIASGRGVGDNFRVACVATLGRAQTGISQLATAAVRAIRTLDERYSGEIEVVTTDD